MRISCADAGSSDAVGILQVGERLDVFGPRVEIDRLRGQRRNAFHLVRGAPGAGPQRDKAGRAARHDVDRVRNQRIVHRVRTVEDRPRDLHVLQAERGGVFFEELVVLHDVELQVTHGELARDADFLRGGRFERCGQNAGHNEEAADLHRVSSLVFPARPRESGDPVLCSGFPLSRE